MDLQKLTVGDRVVTISAFAFLIFMFFPWYGLDNDLIDVTQNGFDYFLSGWIPLVLAIAMVAQIAIVRFGSSGLPKPGPLTWGQIHLIAGALAAFLVLLKVLIGDDVEILGVDVGDLDRKVGVLLAFLAALGLAAGGFLKMRDPADAAPPSSPPPPSASPPPA